MGSLGLVQGFRKIAVSKQCGVILLTTTMMDKMKQRIVETRMYHPYLHVNCDTRFCQLPAVDLHSEKFYSRFGYVCCLVAYSTFESWGSMFSATLDMILVLASCCNHSIELHSVLFTCV
jgi:hypothetical protein